MAMNTRRGFTLISVMIAVVILAIGVLALSRTLAGSMKANSRAGLRTIALDIARQRMEFLRSQPPRTMGDFAETSGVDVDERGRVVNGGKYRRTVVVTDVRTALVSVTVRVAYPNGTAPVELVTYVYTGAVT
jgi:prepilin-type N-terminal cleavage/methylation domain-containing protein